MRGEKADGVVAPVVGQAVPGQIPGSDELVDGQQLDRRHPEPGQVFHHRRARQPRVRSPQLPRHVTAGLGEPLDVQLIDDRVPVGRAGRPVGTPRERRVGNQRPRHRRRGIQVAAPIGVTRRIAEHAVPPHQLTRCRLGIRVKQQLRRVAPQPPRRVIRPGHPVAIPLAAADPGHEPVPDAAIESRQRQPGFRATLIEQAQHHLLGYLRYHREIRPGLTRRSAQRPRPPRPDLHASSRTSRATTLATASADPSRCSRRHQISYLCVHQRPQNRRLSCRPPISCSLLTALNPALPSSALKLLDAAKTGPATAHDHALTGNPVDMIGT